MSQMKCENQVFETLSKGKKRFKRYFMNPLLNYLIPRFVIRFVFHHCRSPLIKESFQHPGSWRVMKICYENQSGHGWIHWMASKGSALSMGLRNRRILVINRLKDFFESQKGKELSVLSIGSGPGTNLMEAMKKAQEVRVNAFCADLDDSAFSFGEHLRQEFGFNDRVTFIHAEAREAIKNLSTSPDLIKMMGLLEHLSDSDLEALCLFCFESMGQEGVLMVNSCQPNEGIAPFMNRMFGLKMNYRSGKELIDLLGEIGFSQFRIEREPLGIYSLITATK